jgi:hypothetical protein
VRVRVRENLGDLIADFERIKKEAPVELRGVIREGIKTGNSVAKDFARESAGKHGKHYPKAFTTEMRPTLRAYGAVIYSGEYGPDIAYPQGGMSFEYGSRNQPPHMDLNKSADLIGPAMPGEVRRVVDRLFW